MKNISIYVGSRANYSSAFSIMKAIQNHPELNLSLVISGSAVLPRFGDIRELIKKDGFKADMETNSLIEGENPTAMSKSIGLGMIDYSNALEKLKPDCVIAIGDRFDVLPWVISAAMMNIPIAHTMGGERSGTIDESIRHAITKFSNVHFPANIDSAKRIERMGEDPKTIYVVGCPRIDFIRNCLDKFSKGKMLSSQKIFDFYKGVGNKFNLDQESFLLVSFHPVTTEFGSNKNHIKAILESLNELKINTVMIWPNADAGSDEISKEIRIFREKFNPDWLHLFVNLPIEIYTQLMYQCKCMIGNSSSAIREGETIGVPAVNVGSRQNMRLKGKNIIDVEPNKSEIVEAIKSQIKHGKYPSENLYGSGGAGDQIATIISKLNIKNTQKINFY